MSTSSPRFFDRAAHADVPEVSRLARAVDHWHHGLLAYGRTGRASNSKVSEPCNGELEAVDRVARGFRNFHNYRTRMRLKTAASRQTRITPRLPGRTAQDDPAHAVFIA